MDGVAVEGGFQFDDHRVFSRSLSRSSWTCCSCGLRRPGFRVGEGGEACGEVPAAVLGGIAAEGAGDGVAEALHNLVGDAFADRAGHRVLSLGWPPRCGGLGHHRAVLPVHHRPADLVEAFRLARAEREQEMADSPPAILDLASVGRLAASLGQAVRRVSLNHETLAGSARDKWEAIGVLDAASNALTLLGAAVQTTDRGSGRVSVLLSDETVVHARRGLAQTARHLADGTGTCGHGAALDAGVAERMAADRALLPPG
jgi:hypothetical protein